ncbi:glycosyltransferase family 1 protein [soil metagenome]
MVHTCVMDNRQTRPTLPRIRVLFDTTYAHRQDGTGRYTREMLRCLQKDRDLHVLATRAPRIERLHRSARAPVNGAAHFLWSQIWLPVLSRLRNVHIVHTMMIAPRFSPVPTVVTIHDALDFHPRYSPSRLWSTYVRTIGGLGARHADAVVTVSYAAAWDITQHFRVPADVIRVISNASNLHETPPIAIPSIGDRRFFLFVGNDSTRKNLSVAIAALEKLRLNASGVELVVTGSIASDLADGRHWLHTLGGISDPELVWLYQNAVALILPSHYEGFGLPLLEALTFHTPIVASSIPALLEVGGKTVRYVAADDPASFAKELQVILGDPHSARAQASAAVDPHDTTWERASDELVGVYLEVLCSHWGVAG